MNASPAPFVSTILLVGILATGYCVTTPSTDTSKINYKIYYIYIKKSEEVIINYQF